MFLFAHKSACRTVISVFGNKRGLHLNLKSSCVVWSMARLQDHLLTDRVGHFVLFVQPAPIIFL